MAQKFTGLSCLSDPEQCSVSLLLSVLTFNPFGIGSAGEYKIGL